MEKIEQFKKLAKLVRYYILTSTTKAGSGHPTTSLSATDLMTVLFFNTLRFDLKNPQNPANDRVIFSKGHASPLFYSLYRVAGAITSEELYNYRKFISDLEGHPTPNFKYTEAATGSLGQGLSIGVGEALALKYQVSRIKYQAKQKIPDTSYIIPNTVPRVFVLLGDGEMAEGSVWEAIEIASYYKLNNLIGIVDVNRLGQSQETMLGYNTEAYKRRLDSFGWKTFVIDGHNLEEILKTFDNLDSDKPVMIIAKTVKGKGVSFLENKDGWHGKALSEVQLKDALKEHGDVDKSLTGIIHKPVSSIKYQVSSKEKINLKIPYRTGEMVATREAYGEALKMLGEQDERIVVLDGDTKNSTYSEKFKEKFPGRFFEMFIAEQNMVGSATGFAKRGFIPFASTFSAFLTRAFDQIRMAAVSRVNIKLCGSHAGVSIGEDGPSQMGLEDLAMMRSVYGSTVFYPSDAVSAVKLTEIAAITKGIFYIRTTRPKTLVIYNTDEEFKIGGSKIHECIKYQVSGIKQKVTVVAAGITLHEALKAQKELEKEGIVIRVIDCYSVKPIDEETLKKSAQDSKAIITVEDHWIFGGLGEAVESALAEVKIPVYKLAVTRMPRSGKPEELLSFAGIDCATIVKKVKEKY